MNTLNIADPVPGIFAGILDGTYHEIDLCSNSALGSIDPAAGNCPAGYKFDQDNKEAEPLRLPHANGSKEQNRDIGTAFHTAVLQPDLYKDAVVVLEDVKYNSTATKAAWADLRDANPGKIFLRPQGAEKVQGMIRAVYDNPEHEKTRELLSLEGERELTVIGNPTQDSDVLCKSRIDQTVPAAATLIDWKTAADASPVGFGKAAANLGYYRQAKFYLDMLNAAQDQVEFETFIFAVIEKEPPYLPAFYQVKTQDLSEGALEYKRLLHLYGLCLESGEWPGYCPADEIPFLELPGWKFRNQD